jgi:cell division protein FtsB
MENKDIIGSLVTISLSVVGFLIGKSGIVRRYFDNRLSRVEKQQLKEETEVEKTKQENKELHTLVDELNNKVSHLEKELALTNFKLQTLLAYFEKTVPEVDTFIEQLKKQVQ